MMKKILKIQLLLAGICLVCLQFAFVGCGADEELVFFSEEAVLQESEAVGTDLSNLHADVGENGTAADANDASSAQIVVYLCGAVKNAGVFALPEGSRMNDAVLAAGGFTEEAAVTTINLAAKLEDEAMIYVPTWEEAEMDGVLAAEISQTASESELININTADIYVLCSLPGIGESKARDIVTYREKNGTFQKKEDIMLVAGIKENLYREICDMISVK